MAATPEKLVKSKVVSVLKQYGAYFFYPVTSGYGSSGVPDIVVCWQGRFLGIECKTQGKTPTALQTKNLVDIANQGGVAIVIDETGIGLMKLTFDVWNKDGISHHGQIIDWSDAEIDWQAHKKPTE